MKAWVMKLLVINCGSSSIKFEVFEGKDCRLIAGGLLENIGTLKARLRQKRRLEDGTFDFSETVEPVADHAGGFELISRVNARDKIVASEAELFGIGHRVVHGGERFQEPTLITDEVVAAIRGLIPLAPLHNPANLLGIEVLRKSFPRVPQVAVFDTMFHQTLPPRAYHYALPHELYEKYHVRRYGFHGTSHFFVAQEAARHLGRALEETNLITLHLGNGASATAIKNGRSIDTSMGLTPLEGLVMGTRCGDLDPALHFYLLRKTGVTPEELEEVLNSRSGLKGLCGSNDMREILELGDRGDERARLAVDLFCYRIKKYIGAYLAVLGRVDAVVFTGGIGENAPVIREKILEGMELLGMAVDPEKNRNIRGNIAEIQPGKDPTKVGAKDFLPLLVIKTDEELEIARQTIGVIYRRGGSRTAPTGTASAGSTPIEKRQRRSIRLKGYDYSQAGAYFVTVVAQGRECLFGNEEEGGLRLTEHGKSVETAWQWLAEQYRYVNLDEWVVMPNHLHGILIIHDDGEECGVGGGGSRTAPTGLVKRKPLGRLLGAFKTVSSKQINLMRNTPGALVWQRNYYEHVIRDETDLNRVREYIATNPARWAEDDENPGRGGSRTAFTDLA